MNADIVSLNETHLQGENIIEVDGYVWFGLNREMHTKAYRASGGVGMLVRSILFLDYRIEIIEKYDGIIGLLFQHKVSEYSFVIFSCYLPPENSPWGRDASAFFCRLLSLIYQFSEVDAIYIGGDVNARIGNLEDFIPTIDSIPLRVAIDDYVNTSDAHKGHQSPSQVPKVTP